jgi:hypothetical protein
MASTRCWKCRDRPSSRAGGFCYTCWVAAGKPEKEKALALRAEALDPRAVPLTTDLADTLPAMRFVISNPASADTTHQHKSMREWREASTTSFYGRLAAIEPRSFYNGGQTDSPRWCLPRTKVYALRTAQVELGYAGT